MDQLTSVNKKVLLSIGCGLLAYYRKLGVVPSIGVSVVAYLLSEQLWPEQVVDKQKKENEVALNWGGGAHNKQAQDWFGDGLGIARGGIVKLAV